MYKRLSNLAGILMILVLILPGCNSLPTQSSQTQPTTSVSQTSGIPPTQSIYLDIDFPNGAPPLNQAAQLKCTIKSPGKTIDTSMNLKVKLPDAFQLVNGKLDWQGIVPPQSEVVAIDANIKAIEIGNWTIDIPFHYDTIPGSGDKGDGIENIYVAVMETSAQWGRVPPWIGPPTPVPVTSIMQKSMSPIAIDLTTPNPPQLNVPFNLTCNVFLNP